MGTPKLIKKSAKSRNLLSANSLPVTLLLLAFATPPELSLDLGGLRLSPYRLVVIAMFGPCLYKLCFGAAGKWSLSDGLMIFHGLWVLVALCACSGIGQGIESGGIYIFEAVGGYLIGRCLVRNPSQFLGVASMMLSVMATMMVVACFESVTGNHFIRNTSRAVFGGPPLPFIEPRLGLHRAFASFDHPILYGIFCASTLGMMVYLPSRKKGIFRRSIKPLIACTATFFSLSSGAFSTLGVQLFFIGWDFATRGIVYRWAALGSMVASFWIFLTLISNRGPVKVFLTYFTFSPGTGYNRLRIWEYGSAEAMRHPVFGIGLGDWERPSWMVSGSMDNFWLATAVRYGIPAFLFLAAVLLAIGINQLRCRSRDLAFMQCRSAWLVSIAGLSIAGCTVHFWNALFCLFCFLIGCGVWMRPSDHPKK